MFPAEKLVPKDSKDFDSRDFGAFAHTDINITLTITVYCTDHCSIFTIHLYLCLFKGGCPLSFTSGLLS